jgi:HEPN domain-containing protein
MDTSKKMTGEEKFEYWLDIAQYDLKTAAAMYRTGRWLYVVFMCQQALEKLVKGLYLLYLGKPAQKIHDIRTLFLEFSGKLIVPVDETIIEFFSRLSSFYLNTRYTDYKEKLSATVNKHAAKVALKKTKEVFAWLLTLKPSTVLFSSTSTM